MIIHAPTSEAYGDRIRIAARVEFEQAPFRFEDPLWFEFPRAYAPELSSGAFLAALLPIAMHFEKRIVLRGALSPRLEYNLREVERILNFWRPQELPIIPISFDGYTVADGPSLYKGGALCAFSGGGDAWYTLLKQPHITHALFVHGFDIPLKEQAVYDALVQQYTPLLAQRSIELIPVSTNIQNLRSATDLSEAWDWMENFFIIGAGIFLRKSFPLFYFSDDYSFDYKRPFGLYHYRMLSLLSSEEMQMRTYGDPATKLERLAFIAEHSETYGALRVCMKRNPARTTNCGRCAKCLLVMTHLDTLGVLERYTTFATSLDRTALRRIRYADPRYARIPWERIRIARQYGRPDVALDYTFVHLASALKRLVH